MKRSRWPLFLIATPAAVAIWSGWVGLGQKAGFGMVRPLPGIVNWHLDTAITLPVGIEAYGAYALGVWLSARGVPAGVRTFAKWSAIGALALGMTGQVSFHLLVASHDAVAPWLVTVLVSCVPVVVVGLAAALTHLLMASEERGVHGRTREQLLPRTWKRACAWARSMRGDAPEPESAPALASAPVTVPALNGQPQPARTETAPEKRTPGAPDPRTLFAGDLASGALPSKRAVMRQMHVGAPRADEIRAGLEREMAGVSPNGHGSPQPSGST